VPPAPGVRLQGHAALAAGDGKADLLDDDLVDAVCGVRRQRQVPRQEAVEFVGVFAGSLGRRVLVQDGSEENVIEARPDALAPWAWSSSVPAAGSYTKTTSKARFWRRLTNPPRSSCPMYMSG
jgi:hypothetical protein